MSVRTKKQVTSKGSVVHRLSVNVDDKTYVFRNVPQIKFNILFKDLETLASYKEKKEEKDDSTDWRKDFSKLYDSVSGEEAYKESAVAVKAARLSEEMAQSELAKKLNIPQGNLSKIENAKRPVGKALAKKLGNIFGLDFKVFLSDLPG